MQLEPLDILSRYRFILSAFGLDLLRTTIYQPGKPIEPKQAGGFTATITDKGEPNMHTGFSTGKNLRPVKSGKQAVSPLGTPVYSDMILFKRTEQETNGIHLTWCITEVEQSKNIVKTAPQGWDGTVKEYISKGDYIVTLRGAISNTFMSNYPKEEMKIFLDLLNQNVALKVTSEFLLQFKIYELVVDNYKMGQESGKQNIQTFEITCSSDRPLLLKKKNVSS
jgi:Domain of unknown function (DUF6046)